MWKLDLICLLSVCIYVVCIVLIHWYKHFPPAYLCSCSLFTSINVFYLLLQNNSILKYLECGDWSPSWKNSKYWSLENMNEVLRDLNVPWEMMIIRKRGEEGRIVLMGLKVDNGGSEGNSRGRVEYWRESGQRASIVFKSGLFYDILWGLDHLLNASGLFVSFGDSEIWTRWPLSITSLLQFWCRIIEF